MRINNLLSPAHFNTRIKHNSIVLINTMLHIQLINGVHWALFYLLAAAAYARPETAPEVYTVIPPQPLEKKPGQLEQWQLDQFFDKGFVQVNNFFTKEELQPALEVSRLKNTCKLTIWLTLPLPDCPQTLGMYYGG